MKIVVLGGLPNSLVRFRGPMLAAMVHQGHEVIGMAGAPNAQVEAELKAMGVTFRLVPLGRTGINPFRDLATLRALVAAFREIKPDLVLTYTIKPVIYGSLAAAWTGVPHRHAMITGRGSSLQGKGFPLGILAFVAKLLYRKGLAKISGVFFQNPDDLAFFKENHLLPRGCCSTLINGSGVDLAHYAQVPLPPGPITFLFVGRLVRDKGVVEYIEAAKIIKQRHPEVRFILVGPLDSNPTAIGKKMVDDWVGEKIIDYRGLAADVRPHLAEAHVFVLPSYGEGTPRSVLEAMSMGRAVISTLAPGCKETVLDGQTGFLVPVKNPQALADAMERFLSDPALAQRFGNAGLALAEDRFDVHKVNQVILDTLGLRKR